MCFLCKQAHARLMCHNEVILQDAVVAILLMESSMSSTSIVGIESVLHSDFIENPDNAYQIQENMILTKLGILKENDDTNNDFNKRIRLF